MHALFEEMTSVGEWSSPAEAHEHALVVLAMNADCRVREAGGTYRLEVDPAVEPRAREELALYAEENRDAPAKPPETPTYSAGVELAVLWVLSLVVVFALQLEHVGFTDRFANASRAVFEQGEWWRSFTSLFLHADAEHLLGNVCIGGVFCLLVASSLGPWRGWLLIFASGFLGNLLNARLHLATEPDFASIGASTATFGALGLLVGHGLRLAWRHRHYRDLKPLIAPLGAGFGLFGWFGVGGVDTDVSAHLLGMACGAVLGWLATRGKAFEMSPRSDPQSPRQGGPSS